MEFVYPGANGDGEKHRRRWLRVKRTLAKLVFYEAGQYPFRTDPKQHRHPARVAV
jgi:hypothetical protein